MQQETELLQRVIRLLTRDPAAIQAPFEPRRLIALRDQARQLLGRADLLAPLMEQLRLEGQLQTDLGDPIQELVRLGLLQVQSVPGYRVWPADRGGPQAKGTAPKPRGQAKGTGQGDGPNFYTFAMSNRPKGTDPTSTRSR